MTRPSLRILCGFALLALATCGVTAQESPDVRLAQIEKRLLGEWVGVSGHWGEENPLPSARRFVFRGNHEVEVVIGKDRFIGRYQIAVSQTPFEIDFTFETDGRKISTLTIFDFPGEGQLRMAEWDPNWRRKEFNPGITFQKQGTPDAPAPPNAGKPGAR